MVHLGLQALETTPIINASLQGHVINTKTNRPIAGATVRLKGVTHSVKTDEQGSFQFITGQKLPFTVVVSSVGFLSKEIVIETSPAQISLTEASQDIDEVLVVGYGTQKRQDLIGSLSQISSKQVENRPNPQLSNILTGQLAGVSVIQRSGKPGASAGTINIRGVGSFGAGTNPLIIVDGIQASSFNEIDPNDVASISVLKDASSAAIYGARAANGVIIISTKSGKEGSTNIHYNTYTGFQQATALPEFVNSWEFAQLYNEATNSQSYTEEDIQKFKAGNDLDFFPNTNFLDAVISKRGIQTSHSLMATGGNEKNQFLISGGYLFQDGLVVKNNYSRYNFRLNLQNKLSDKLTLSTKLSAIQSHAKEPGTPATLDSDGVLGIISSAVRYPAIYAGKLSDGSYGLGVVQKGTPISFLESASFGKSKEQNLTANIRLDYNLFSAITLSAIVGYNQQINNEKEFFAEQVLNPILTLGPNQLFVSNANSQYKTLQLLADYKKDFLDQHHLGVLLGVSYEGNYSESLSASRDKLPGNDLTEIDVGAENNQKNNGTASEWAIQSLFGRLKYDFDSRYLMEATLRYDGSSRFPTSQKYALFPSIAVGWRIGQEGFLKNKISWFSDLKLKASYGVLGNQNISNYPYQNTLTTGVNYPFGGAISSGVALTQLTDPNLHWESTRNADLGLDFSLFSNKLSLGATYFNRQTYDILYSPSASVSSILGFQLSQQNTGKVSNIGFEFSLNHHQQLGDFAYNLASNLTILNNEVKDLGVGNVVQANGLIGNGSSLFIGRPLELYYGYQADGLFVDQSDIDNWANMSAINPVPKPGDIRYKDLSGPEGIPDGKVDATYDRIVLGSRIPKYSFGINLGANYKNLDFSALIQGVSSVKGNLGAYAGYAFNNFGNIQRWQMDERWTPENQDRNAGYPRLEIISNSGTPNTLSSSFWTVEASYVKIKNIQVGYSLSQSFLNQIHLAKARLYLSVDNLVNWNSYRKGWDPEINSNGSFYPILATYTAGLNLSF